MTQRFKVWSHVYKPADGHLRGAVVNIGQTSNQPATARSLINRERSDDSVSPGVQCLAATDGRFVPYTERREALRGLSRPLGESEISMMTNFLHSSGAQTPGLTQSERLALKNDALDILQRQEVPVTGLGEALSKMLDDPLQPQGWRDYCLQGLPYQYARAKDFEDPATAEAERGLVLGAIDNVFADPGKGEFRGTALRGIDNLARDYPEVSSASGLEGKVRAVVTDLSADEPSLITALRMYSSLKLTGDLMAISNIATKGSTPLLRKVALKTLDELNAAEGTVSLPAARGAR